MNFSKNQENLIIAVLAGVIGWKLYKSYQAKKTTSSAQPLITTNNALVSPAQQNAPTTNATLNAGYTVKYIAGMGKLAVI